MELIDGNPVIYHRVRFTKRVEIDERYTDELRDGSIVMWLVRARCQPPSYHPVTRKDDDLDRYRLNVQDLEEAIPLTGALRESAIVHMEHGEDQSYLAFQNPSYDAAGTHDPREVSAQARLDILRFHLTEVGVIHDGEDPVDAAMRLLKALPSPDEIREYPESEESWPVDPKTGESLGAAFDDVEDHDDWRDATTVVGSIYRGGKSKTQTVLEEQFGSMGRR